MRDHTKLKVFDLADRLVVQIYKRTGRFPESERYGLQSQMRRAAISIAANIVEGCARTTAQEYARFIEIAYGSARELQYQISLAQRLEYFAADDAGLHGECTSVAKLLSALLRSLRT